MKKNKKAQALAPAFSELSPIAILIGVSVLLFIIMTTVVQEIRDTQLADLYAGDSNETYCNETLGTYSGCAGSGSANFSEQGLTLFTNIGDQFPLLGTITILGIVVLVLVGVFGRFIELRA